MSDEFWLFNVARRGLSVVFRDYQIEAMRFVWEVGEEGAISKEVWAKVNERLVDKTISRASVINFLNAMLDAEVLNYTEKTGKGGYHRVYSPAYTQTEFKELLATKILERLSSEFPEETQKVVQRFKQKPRWRL